MPKRPDPTAVVASVVVKHLRTVAAVLRGPKDAPGYGTAQDTMSRVIKALVGGKKNLPLLIDLLERSIASSERRERDQPIDLHQLSAWLGPVDAHSIDYEALEVARRAVDDVPAMAVALMKAIAATSFASVNAKAIATSIYDRRSGRERPSGSKKRSRSKK